MRAALRTLRAEWCAEHEGPWPAASSDSQQHRASSRAPGAADPTRAACTLFERGRYPFITSQAPLPSNALNACSISGAHQKEATAASRPARQAPRVVKLASSRFGGARGGTRLRGKLSARWEESGLARIPHDERLREHRLHRARTTNMSQRELGDPSIRVDDEEPVSARPPPARRHHPSTDHASSTTPGSRGENPPPAELLFRRWYILHALVAGRRVPLPPRSGPPDMGRGLCKPPPFSSESSLADSAAATGGRSRDVPPRARSGTGCGQRAVGVRVGVGREIVPFHDELHRRSKKHPGSAARYPRSPIVRIVVAMPRGSCVWRQRVSATPQPRHQEMSEVRGGFVRGAHCSCDTEIVGLWVPQLSSRLERDFRNLDVGGVTFAGVWASARSKPAPAAYALIPDIAGSSSCAPGLSM